MKDSYSIPEFYLLLKLGLFKGGKVGNWGHVSVCTNPLYLRKPLEEYQKQFYAKTQLGVGLYLQDLYLLQENLYIMVVAVCRTSMKRKEKIYILKLYSNYPVEGMTKAIKESVLYKKPISIRTTKMQHRRVTGSPLNAFFRK